MSEQKRKVPTMDLYKAYKIMKQRAKRRPHDHISQELSKIARSIFYFDGDVEKILTKIQAIREVEKKLQYGLKCYGKEMEDAVLSGKYTIERPYAIRHRFDRNNRKGLIYVMSSKSRPGQVKLGATTLSIYKRLKCYENKYQYSVKAEKWKTVVDPFVLENDIAKKINKYRVAGNTTGDSNEWYHLSPEQLWNVVIESTAPTN
jgi:hypothetical protein